MSSSTSSRLLQTLFLLLSNFVSTTGLPAVCLDTSFYPIVRNTTCLTLITKEMRYSDAAKEASQLGGILTSVQNRYENNELADYAHGRTFFIGLICISSIAADCLWSDGSSSTYRNFAKGQPNPQQGTCVVYNGITFEWYSIRCEESRMSMARTQLHSPLFNDFLISGLAPRHLTFEGV